MPDAPDHDRDEPFDIETVSLDRAIDGNEGLDVNHASRLRMQFLVSQQASLVTQTQFADAKAAALMTLMGLLALNGPVKIGEIGQQHLEALIIFVMMIAAIGCAMWAIVPRIPDAGHSRLIKRRDRYSWPALVCQDYDSMDHARFMRVAEASQLIMSIAQSNCAMARVLHRKFQFLRAAFVFAGIDLVLIVGYVLGLRLS